LRPIAVSDDKFVALGDWRQRIGGDTDIAALILGGHRLTPPQQRISAERNDNQHHQSPSVDTRMALIVCIRFSACSNAMLQRDSKTSFVTSIPLARP
jgi:hypothetical protein